MKKILLSTTTFLVFFAVNVFAQYTCNLSAGPNSGVFFGKLTVNNIIPTADDEVIAISTTSPNTCYGRANVLPNGLDYYINLTIYGDIPGCFRLLYHDVSTGNVSQLSTDFCNYVNMNGGPIPAYSDFNAVYAFPEPTPLPIELVSFTATTEKDHIALDWETATEINNAYFEVERSTNGHDFRTIAQFAGAGTSYDTNQYHYEDKEAFDLDVPTLYYRLKQIDENGTYTHSIIRAVKIPEITREPLSVYPNPFTSLLAIESVENEDVIISIINSQGIVVRTETVFSGQNKLTMMTGDLAPGFYFVRFQIGDRVESRKVVKL